MKKHPGLFLKDGTPHHDLSAFVYGEEIDLVIFDWYINKEDGKAGDQSKHS
ncbi:MAG: hypothetical protein ACP5LR_06465 [Athalassotoga sp.]|uniref:hypothetical protein n=1 Tax=Athalassotoga sp. TaxID=2022597 RepID=UPI00267AB9E6